MIIAAAKIASVRDRQEAPMVLKIIENVKVITKEKARNVKKADNVLLRFVMKYTIELKRIVLQILYGILQIMEETASANG